MLLLGAVVLGFTIRFYIISRKSLKQTIQDTVIPRYPPAHEETKKQSFSDQWLSRFKKSQIVPITQTPVHSHRSLSREESIEAFKESVFEQQKILNNFLRKIDEMENEGKEELKQENKELTHEIERLEMILEKKNSEISELKQQSGMSHRMAAKIEEAYQELEQLQTKMVMLEKQASRANNLAIELEDTRQSYEQIHKDLQRKQEKLEEIYNENESLQQSLNTLEDKLAEANLQRQQLQKKVVFLQDLNTDLQSISDTNKKLQTELRKIAELESKLSMIAEERDYLLGKQSNK